MTEKIVAPFTDEQVAALNKYQNEGWMHSFTCSNRSDGNHQQTSDLGILIATPGGWICPSCDYTQDWAHNFMTEPNPYTGGINDTKD